MRIASRLTVISISGRLRIIFVALFQASVGKKFRRTVLHSPRLEDLSVTLFRVLIDDPTCQVAHLMR